MTRKWLAPLGAALLAALGVGGAIALADTAGSSVCAAVTAATHTIAVDSNPVATVGGEVSTTCVPVPTFTTVTTAATTTVPPATPTFASQTAYTNTPPSFTVKRTITFSDRASLNSAVANALPGDLIKPASTPLAISASVASGGVLNISKRLTALAEIDLRGVTIKNTGTTVGYPAIYLTNPSWWYIEGGIATDPTSGSCILQFAGQHITWYHFVAKDCAGDGYSMFTSTSSYSYGGPIQNNDVEGDISNTGDTGAPNDPHAENCTGIHGMNLADGNFFEVSSNRIALNVHDENCNGGAISFGTDNATPLPTNNTIILQCTHFTFISTIQTGGNCYQTWGHGNQNTDIKYLNASDLTGHAYHADDGSMYGSGQTGKLTTDTVEYGRASGTDKNSRYAGDPTFSTFDGTKFLDVSCTSPASPCIGVSPN